MKDFITYLLNQIVSHPEEIKVEEIDESGMFLYKVEVAKEDMGAVIGKEGRTIKSIRSLVRAKAIKDAVRARLELVDKDMDTIGALNDSPNEESSVQE